MIDLNRLYPKLSMNIIAMYLFLNVFLPSYHYGFCPKVEFIHMYIHTYIYNIIIINCIQIMVRN